MLWYLRAYAMHIVKVSMENGRKFPFLDKIFDLCLRAIVFVCCYWPPPILPEAAEKNGLMPEHDF